MVEIDPKRLGFISGKSTVDAIFIVRQLVKQRIEGNLSVCGFVDLEKAYDRVPREVLYWCLRRKGVTEKLVRLVTETYRDAKTSDKGGVTPRVRLKSTSVRSHHRCPFRTPAGGKFVGAAVRR